MTKEPFSESEEEEENFGGEPKLEEEAEPATPLPEKRKRIEMWSSDRKKSTSAFKTPVPPKQPTKMPQKRESSQKKPKKK